MDGFGVLPLFLTALGKNPNTGDNSVLLTWVILGLLAVSAAVLIYLGISSKKRKRRK